jgi:hypothetical protein
LKIYHTNSTESREDCKRTVAALPYTPNEL